MPHGHSKATTFIGGLRLSGMTAPLATAWFLVNVKQILVQTLASGDIVILDVRVRLWPVLRAMMDLGFGYAAARSALVGCQFHGRSSSIWLAG